MGNDFLSYIYVKIFPSLTRPISIIGCETLVDTLGFLPRTQSFPWKAQAPRQCVQKAPLLLGCLASSKSSLPENNSLC